MTIEYATLNPLAKGHHLILSNGDLTLSNSQTSFWGNCRATIGKPISEGEKWYWEHTIDVLGAVDRQMHGFSNADAPLGGVSSQGFLGLTDDSVGIRKIISFGLGDEFYSGTRSNIAFDVIAANDVIGHELDLDANTYRQSINGVWQGYVTRGFPATVAGNYSGSPQLIYPAYGLISAQQITLNFGESAFASTPPDGANSGWFQRDEVAAAGRRRRMFSRGNR